MKKSSLVLFGLALALCIFGAAGITPLDIYSNSTGKFIKPSYLVDWPDATTQCKIETIGKEQDWTISVTDAAVNWGGCGVFSNKTIDISGYSEIEVIAYLKVAGGESDDENEHVGIQIQLQDESGANTHVQFELTEDVNTYVFPVANFNNINLKKITSFIINTFNMNNVNHVRKAVIKRFRFSDRTIFRVYTDATSITTSPPSGPPVLYSWGEVPCNPYTVDNSAPEGKQVLFLPAGAWGCGIIHVVAMNLEKAKSLLFWLRSNVDVLIEITDNYNHKASFTIPSTKNVWAKQTIQVNDMTSQGLDMTAITYQFMVTKIGTATPTARLDNIRFSLE